MTGLQVEKRQKNSIKSLKDYERNERISLKDMEATVEKFYQTLYKENNLNKDMQNEYLKVNNKLRISEEQKKILEDKLSINEIEEAMKKQK